MIESQIEKNSRRPQNRVNGHQKYKWNSMEEKVMHAEQPQHNSIFTNTMWTAVINQGKRSWDNDGQLGLR